MPVKGSNQPRVVSIVETLTSIRYEYIDMSNDFLYEASSFLGVLHIPAFQRDNVNAV
jgi:C-terminal processing protease CtpA/Prc